MAQALPIHAPSDWYPTRARIRLARLGAAIEANGQQWVPPRDVVYFDEDGLDSDDFYDVDGDSDDADVDGARTGASYRSVRQRAIAATIVIAIAATSASVVLALVFG
jgi:hypothetical protein